MTALSRYWNFLIKCAPPSAPFSYQSDALFCEWDYFCGSIHGYIQFKQPSPPLPSVYESIWKPSELKYCSPLKINLTYSFGKPIRPPFTLPTTSPDEYARSVTIWRKRLKLIRRSNKHDSVYRNFPCSQSLLTPQVTEADFKELLKLPQFNEDTTLRNLQVILPTFPDELPQLKPSLLTAQELDSIMDDPQIKELLDS